MSTHHNLAALVSLKGSLTQQGAGTMDTGNAIFLGLALIALAIFATDAMRPAQAGAGQADGS